MTEHGPTLEIWGKSACILGAKAMGLIQHCDYGLEECLVEQRCIQGAPENERRLGQAAQFKAAASTTPESRQRQSTHHRVTQMTGPSRHATLA